MLTPSLKRAAIEVGLAFAALGCAFLVGLTVGQRHQAAKAEAVQTQSDQAEGAAKSHAVQAVTDHQQGAAADAATTSAAAKVATAKRDLGLARARLHPQVPLSSASASERDPMPALPPSSAAPEAAFISAKQDAVIAAQDEQIHDLQASLAAAQAEAAQWHQAYDESQKALALQKVAEEATVRSEHAQGLRGEIVRGLEGLAVGYAAGRFHR